MPETSTARVQTSIAIEKGPELARPAAGTDAGNEVISTSDGETLPLSGAPLSTETTCSRLGLDYKLVKLKVNQLNRQLRKEIKKETNAIYWNNRNNCNSTAIPSQILEMQRRKTADWAAKESAIYYEVGQLRGQGETAYFVRTVHSWKIVPLIHARRNAVVHEAERLAHRTGESARLSKPRIDAFRRSMDALETELGEAAEIEARTIELRAATVDETPTKQKRKELTSFDGVTGELMSNAWSGCRRLQSLPNGEPHPKMLQIAKRMDELKFDLLENLQRGPRQQLGDYNRENPTKAVTTWEDAIKSRGNRQKKGIQQIAKRRMYLAANRYKKIDEHHDQTAKPI